MKRSTIVIVVLAVFFGMVVSCGILAAIAIPAFTTYMRRAKVVEAQARLGALRQGVESYCAQTSTLPSAAGPTPAVPGSTAQSATWDGGWVTVGFAPMEPVYYAYSLVPVDASTLVVRAEGDLDDDGTRSRFESRCTLAVGGCTCGDVVATDDLE